jgi:hypothetical protein
MLGTKKYQTGFPRKEMTTLVTKKTEQIKKKFCNSIFEKMMSREKRIIENLKIR